MHKNQLLKLSQHYKVMVDARYTRDTIQSILLANLQEEGVLVANDGKSGVATSGTGLTFEQQLPQRMELQGNGGHEVCHYCQKEGYCMKECPALNSRGKIVQVK